MPNQELKEITVDLAARLAASRPPHQGQVYTPPPYNGPCNIGPDCQVCGGSGFYRLDVEPWHQDFGKLHQCPNVSVWKHKGAAHFGLYEDELSQLTWESVLPIYDGKALEAARIIEQILGEGHGWVYLYGDHGQAKTLILKIAAATYLRANKMAAYANMTDVINHIRQAFDTHEPNRESENRLQWWAELPLLCLDEFDRFNNTKWATESQFRLMDERNVQAIRGQTITLIASNQPPDELDGYYRSRINDGRFMTLPLYGQDARPAMSRDDKF